MDIVEEKNAGYQITAYSPNSITLNAEIIHQSLLLTPKHYDLIDITHLNQITPILIEKILTLKPELFLIGTGEKGLFPDKTFYLPFAQAKIGLEILSTPSACRTYNILLSEGRNLIALFIIDKKEDKS